MSEFSDSIQIQQISLRDAFRNRQTGAIIPYNDSSKLAYEKRPDLYIPPLNYNFSQGVWKPWSFGREITITYRRVLKNESFIIQATDQTRDVQYRYTSSENLYDSIRSTLAEMNADYHPSQRWTTSGSDDDGIEWWVDNSLSLLIRSGDRRGFAEQQSTEWTGYSPGGMWQGDLFDQQSTVPNLFHDLSPLSFNGKPIHYRLPHLEYDPDQAEERCCWNYLRGHNIPYKKLRAIKGNNDDAWTFEELNRVAKQRKQILEIFDIHGDSYKEFHLTDGKITFNTPYRYLPPTHDKDGKRINLRRGLAFMTIGKHVYPFNKQFQCGLLRSLGQGGARSAKCDLRGQVDDGDTIGKSQRYIDGMPEGKAKQKKQEKYDADKAEYEDSMYWEKGTFVIGKAKYNYYAEPTLDDVVRDIYYETNQIFSMGTDRNGNINQIWFAEFNEKTKKPELVWRLSACPNYLVMKPIYERFTMVYKGEDVDRIGISIYQDLIGERFSYLKSQTCGNIFEMEQPFNYSTDVLVKHAAVNTYPKELADWQEATSVKELLRNQYMRDQKQQHYEEATSGTNGQDEEEQEIIDEYMGKKPEPHGEMFCEEFGEVLCLDFNKFYSSRLENPHNPFMKYENFDNVEPYKPCKEFRNGFYYCEIPDDLEPGEFIPFADKTTGWYCKSVVQMAMAVLPKEKRPTITHQYIPHARNIIDQTKFTRFVEFVYAECKDLGIDHAPKTIINHFVGTLGKTSKEAVVEKAQLIRDWDDRKYQEMMGMQVKPFAEARGEQEELWMSYTTKLSDRRWSGLPIHVQILQEAKVELEALRRKLKFQVTKSETKVVQEKGLSFGVWKHSRLASKWVKKYGYHPVKLDEGYQTYLRSLCRTEEVVTEEIYACPIMFKTDSIVIADFGSGKLSEAIADVDIGDNRGQLKVEWDTRTEPDRSKLRHTSKQLFQLKKKETQLSDTNRSHQTKFSRTDVYGLIEKRKSFRIQGMAGTGKSSLLIGEHERGIIPYMQEKGLEFALCSPTHKAAHNKLFEEAGVPGVTCDSLLGMSPGIVRDPNFKQLKHLDYIIIDECSMLSKQHYNHLKHIKILYPDLHFILVGDFQQLPPVEPTVVASYRYDESNVMRWLCDYNLVELTENMRSGEEGEQMFKWFSGLMIGLSNPRMESDLSVDFDKDYSAKQLYWHKRNLCYTNAAVAWVNWQMVNVIKTMYKDHLTLQKLKPVRVKGKKIIPAWLKLGIWCGDRKTHPMCELVAIKKDEDGTFYNNQDFCIITWCNDEAVLECRSTGEHVTVPAAKLYKCFNYNFASTVHRSQGSTYDEPYSIWEWDMMLGSEGNALKYVAVSRTKSKGHINIMKHKCNFSGRGVKPPGYKEFKEQMKGIPLKADTW